MQTGVLGSLHYFKERHGLMGLGIPPTGTHKG
jgi:hypothetical protein